MVIIINEPAQERTTEEQVAAAFRKFVWLRASIENLQAEQDEAKGFLLKHLQDHGEIDDKGHAWLDFGEPIEGYNRMQRQRRVSQKLDEAAAEALLNERGVRDRCYRTVEVLDQEAIMGLVYEGVLTEQDIETMFPKAISYAFVPVKK